MYTAFLGPQARKFLKKSEKELYPRIKHKIEELEKNPFPSEVERVKGSGDQKIFRVRVGQYRIKYIVYHEKKEILVFDIDRRETVYN